jgi:DNA repair exonuclease SbcCD ATPase subunit
MNEETTHNMNDGRSFEERVMARFDALDASMRDMDARLTAFEERVNARLDAFEARLDKMEARLDGMDARLTSLEERVDQRLKETRPIWEQVLVRLDGMDARFDKFDARLAGVEKILGILNRKFRVFNEEILAWQNQQEDLEERVGKLESEQAK